MSPLRFSAPPCRQRHQRCRHPPICSRGDSLAPYNGTPGGISTYRTAPVMEDPTDRHRDRQTDGRTEGRTDKCTETNRALLTPCLDG